MTLFTKMVGLSTIVFLTAACVAPEDADDPTIYAAAGANGLAATYFDNINLTVPRVERVDAVVNFDWGRGAPVGVAANTFSARWVGFVEPRYSETYRFYVRSDDGARLWVDGRALVDEWNDHGPRTFSGTVFLEAGRRYPIRLEYYENGGGAMVRLEWSSANQTRQVIPESQLFTNDGAVEPGGTVRLDVDDAFVDSAAPNANFDTTALEIDGDPSTKYALIKPRDIGSIAPGTRVAKATLVVRGFDGGNSYGVRELGGAWSEDSVTFNNAPGRSSQLASVSGSTGVKSIDVTTIVQGWVDGAPAHGLALYPNGSNGVDLYSSEHGTASYRPHFVVELSDSPDPCSDGGCSEGITHVGTTERWDSNGQNLEIARPSGSRTGDLLILVLHRTDDDLPLHVDGWTRVAECYKRDNGYDCSTENDCTDWANDDFCRRFGDYGRGGHDLAQSVFFRKVRSGEPSSYRFDLNIDSSGHPGWAILTALRGANTTDPVRDWSHTGCDGNADSLFPSVYARQGDMVLLSQSFDDAIAQSKFGAPTGTTRFGYVSNSDEAGFLFGGVVSSTGETGSMKTHGDGGPSCKDALVSLSIKPE